MHQDTKLIDYNCKNHDPIDESASWLLRGGLNDHLNGTLFFGQKITWFLGAYRLLPSKFQDIVRSHLTKWDMAG